MDFTKYLSLLDRSQLYFPNLEALAGTDPHEGLLAQPNYRHREWKIIDDLTPTEWDELQMEPMTAGDRQTAEQRAAEAVRELTETQIHEVESKMRSVRERLKYSGAGALVALAAVVQHQGFGLLSAAATVWPFGAAVLDYRKDVKRHPAFFLWKALSKKKSQRRDTSSL